MTNKKIYLIAIVEGALVMAIELLGGSLIIPFYGNGLEVWTFVLGITMGSLALGYWLGSFVTTFLNPWKWMNFIFPLLAILIFYLPDIAISSFESAVSESYHSLIFKGVFPVLFPPLILCGMVSSLLIFQSVSEGESSGTSAGKIYSFSTFSGVVIALFIGFFALENIDTSLLLFIFSLISIVTVILFLDQLHSTMKWIPSILAFLLIFLVFFSRIDQEIIEPVPGTKTLYKSNGILGEIKVVDDYVAKSRMLFVNNSLQSTLGENGFASLPYVKLIGYFLSHRKSSDNILLAGLGGGNLLKDLKPLGFKFDIVELDQRIIDVSKNFFGVNFEGCNIYIDDARHYLNVCDKKYDIIILDLSIGEVIPSNVYTLDAFTIVKNLLNKNGMIVLHLFSKEDGMSNNSILSLGRTLEETGLHVYLMNNEHEKNLPSPYIFIASGSKINFDDMKYRNYGYEGKRIFGSLESDIRKLDYSAGEILTDDKPSLEIFQREIVSYFRQSYMRDYFKFLTRKN